MSIKRAHFLFSFLFLFFFLLLSTSLKSQKVIHNIQLNGGAISEKPAGIYVGKLDYIPQLRLADGNLRIGIQTGALFRRRSLSVSGGVNASVRVYKAAVFDGSLSIGGIFLRPSYEWSTSSEKIFSTALVVEISDLSLNFTYGRDFHHDQNWFSYGFAVKLYKIAEDEDE